MVGIDGERPLKKRLVRMPVGEGKLYSRFYRDSTVMDFVGKVCMFNRAKSKIDASPVFCWSCGCSSGEEVYTLSLLWNQLLAEHFKCGMSIVGTDISPTQIEKARNGEYSAGGLENLPFGWTDCLLKDRASVVTVDGKEQQVILVEASSSDPANVGHGIDAVAGLFVKPSSNAPAKVKSAFHDLGTGTVIEIRKGTGKCRVVHDKSGDVCTYNIGNQGRFELSPAMYAIHENLRENVWFECQDVRESFPEQGPFDLVLCRYSCFLYLSRNEAWQVLCKIARDKLAPGGYLIIGEREGLPQGFEELGLCQLTDCPSVFQKVAEPCIAECSKTTKVLHRPSTAGGARPMAVVVPRSRPATAVGSSRPATAVGSSRPATAEGSCDSSHADCRALQLPESGSLEASKSAREQECAGPLKFESLDLLLRSQGRKTASDILRPAPWDVFRKGFRMETSPQERSRQAREFGQRREEKEEIICETSAAVQRVSRSLVRKAHYSEQVIQHLSEQREREVKMSESRNKVLSASRLQGFIERMNKDLQQRQENARKREYEDAGSRPKTAASRRGTTRPRPKTAPAVRRCE